MRSEIAAVVVTFNRIGLLRNCLTALRQQTRRPDRVIVVNNASTDGTAEVLKEEGWLDLPYVELLTLSENSGGAGGFFSGMQRAVEDGASWIWMMDDDAVPHPDALATLAQIATEPNNVYGSLAVDGDETSWPTTILSTPTRTTSVSCEVPDVARVQMIPFLGFFIQRDLIEQIGFPDHGYFLAADDVEYCLRVQKIGGSTIVAGRSKIEHPKASTYSVRLPGRTLTCLAIPPWKRYYDTRNRLLIARKHYGFRLYTQTIPGSFVRFIATLIKEPLKIAQARAFFAGLIDGLLGRKGRRHDKWGIS